MTPRTKSQTCWQREISHVMNGIIFCVCLTSAISVAFNSPKPMSKRTQKDAGEERVTAKSKPTTNLVSRCRERDPIVLASSASENQIWKSERTSELVKCAANKYGETRIGRQLIKLLRMVHWRQVVFSRVKNWWSAGSKNGETCQWTATCLFALHTDRFIVDDDDMDSNTVADSDMSLKSRSFLHRVYDRVRKIQDQSSKDATQDSNKHSLIWVNVYFMSSTLQASVCMGKNYLENLRSIDNYRRKSHDETDVWHIWKVDSRTTRWDLWSEYN